MDVKSGMATMAMAMPTISFGHGSGHFLAIDPATVGKNQTNLGIVGHLAMPTKPLLLHPCYSYEVVYQTLGKKYKVDPFCRNRRHFCVSIPIMDNILCSNRVSLLMSIAI